jgi:hypothetical protein
MWSPRLAGIRAWTALGRAGLLAFAALLVAAVASCAATSPAAASGANGPPAQPGTTTVTMAGGRCAGGICKCRKGHGDKAENPPPDEDHKRFEIRVGAEGGAASLDSPTLGKFTGGGANESCFYIDVLPGTSHAVTFTAREGQRGAGISPMLRIAEYGPKGPFWYDVVEVHCAGAGERCTRDAADAWGVDAKKRKRGRIDPCGSSVITHLEWETSGGAADRDSGFFRDFTVGFNMEVKKFPTQFAPGSTECVPK